jgi:serine/threonine protein kinase
MKTRAAPTEDMSLEKRIKLKRSVDDGELVPYDVSEKRSRSLPELTTDPDYLFTRTKLLGSGSYGHVYLLETETGGKVGVAKIIGCASNLLGNVNEDPFRSEHVEPRMIPFLWNACVIRNRATPHLMAPLGRQHKIVNWTTPDQKEFDEDMTQSSVYFMEHATNHVLRYYFSPLTNVEFNLHFCVIFFQICYTLAVIHLRYPGFRHNDFKDDNICMHTTDKGGYYKYTFKGCVFYVPRIGTIPILSDFDFACIPGYMMDNYKTLEQEWDTPSFSIGTREDQCSDLWTLVAYIRKKYPRRFVLKIQKELNTLFGRPKENSRKESPNSLRPMPNEAHVTATQVLLESTLFDDFRQEKIFVKDVEIHESYCADIVGQVHVPEHIWNSQNFLHEIPADHAQNKRHCPLIYHQNHTGGGALLPSQRLYLCWDPDDAAVDNEPPVSYTEHEGERLLRLMEPLYDEAPHFNFAPDMKETFLDATLENASRFLQTRLVPIRWWPAAFTCAWMDAALDLSLYKDSQQSWGTYKWTVWWRTFGNTRYTEMQLLHFFLQWSWPRVVD